MKKLRLKKVSIYRSKNREGCPHRKCLRTCRPGRPQCRAMRKVNPKWQICECGAYHFPHRKGSGNCGNPERIWEFMDQPLRNGVPA